MRLAKCIRPLIIGVNIGLATLIYAYIRAEYSTSNLSYLKLTDIYGLMSFWLLYISLMISPVYTVFTHLKYRQIAIRSRRALGVSSCGFAVLHSQLGFFYLLDGFNGLAFLGPRYSTYLFFGFIGLIILTLLSLTSFDTLVRKLGKYWKWLHKLVYVAGLLILFHIYLLGSSFRTTTSISIITTIAVCSLTILESLRIDQYIAKKWKVSARFGIAFTTCVAIYVLYGAAYVVFPELFRNDLSVHSQHE
jgi:DMSO/TMAO reductase YedYZ heme-binding membrane subunit